MSEFVEVEVADSVATIRLNRPPMNALCRQMQEEIAEAARSVSERRDVGAVVVYGGPKLFAAGADVKEMASLTYQDMVRAAGRLQACFAAVAAIPQPTIAAVTGYALGGGCELAMCCDIRIAEETVQMGQPEMLLGIIPGAGGTQRLPRLVGPSVAKDLVFTGRFVDASEAHAIGLVNTVVGAGAAYDAAMDYARRLARGPALALRAAKQAIDRGLDVDLATGLTIESQHFAGCFATDDARTGMASFVQSGPGKATFSGD